jgi:serine phosphatase RsbU (regulator of sigma subunit)
MTIQELRIRTPDNKVRRVTLEGDALSLGRAHTNDLCYPEDASLSRKHLVLERSEEGWSVTDLGSKNGTLLNGERVAGPRLLRAGDRLVVGQLAIACVASSDEPDANIVFVPSTDPDLPSSATVMTSLEGLLSGEAAAPAPSGTVSGEMDAARQFQLPVVRALIRAGRELAGHQPLEELFETILDQATSAVKAERGVLMTLERGKLVPRATHGEGFRISTTVRDRVLQNKESLLVRDVGQELALQRQMSISEQQIHSLMAVPLQTQQEVIGLIYVDSRLFVREFTPDDLNLLTVLANVAAIRIDHERYLQLQRTEQRRTRELEQAAEIQRSILPRQPPQVTGLDLAGHNAPCRTVGGDYYDFIPCADGRLAVVLGDVAGKGMAAAMLMSNLQARVQMLTESLVDLATLMSRLDKSLAARCPSNRFITLFLCVIDPRSGDMCFCNAGHNPALIVRNSGAVERLTALGTVLGVLPELGYEEQRGRLEPGDILALYSDGITEATDAEGEEFGEDRLARLLVERRGESAEAVVGAIAGAVSDWCPSEVADDDITLLVVRRTG